MTSAWAVSTLHLILEGENLPVGFSIPVDEFFSCKLLGYTSGTRWSSSCTPCGGMAPGQVVCWLVYWCQVQPQYLCHFGGLMEPDTGSNHVIAKSRGLHGQSSIHLPHLDVAGKHAYAPRLSHPQLAPSGNAPGEQLDATIL